MSDFLTVEEVAERMRCEHRTVRRAIHAGELEAAMIGGRWLIREQAMDAWFDSKTLGRQATSAGRGGDAPSMRRPARPSPPHDRVGSPGRLKAMEGGRR